MLKRSIILLILLGFFIFPLITLAQESTTSSQLKSEVETQDLYPGMPYYQIKRLREKINGWFLFSFDSRFNYSKKLLKFRFSELDYIIEKQNLSEVQRSSERFAYEAGKLTDLTEDQSKEKKQEIVNLFKNYKEDLNQLKFKFAQDSGFWILVLHDINTLDYLTARLEKD